MSGNRRTIEDVVGDIRMAHGRGRKVNLLIGAGCSVSAGIPSANGFVKTIRKENEAAYNRAKRNCGGREPGYPDCMGQLQPQQQRDLVREAIEKSTLNWAHLGIAQLIKCGVVERVLTTNFDPLVARACALVGEFPGIYDFAASQTFRAGFVAEKAIFYLHGQSTGFIHLHNKEQCENLAKELPKLFEDCNRGQAWIVAGYSGDNDPVLKVLGALGEFPAGLYWCGFESDPNGDVNEHLLNQHATAYYVPNCDADALFVRLAQSLKAFPPEFIAKPFTHMRDLLGHVPPFSPSGSDGKIDIAGAVKKQVTQQIATTEPGLRLQTYLLAGDHSMVLGEQSAILKSGSGDEKHWLAWAHVIEADSRGDTSQPEAEAHYADAVRIKPDMHEAFYNWGVCLASWAKRRPDTEAGDLLRQAGEKYAEAVRIKPDMHEAFFNWGVCLDNWAKRRPDTEAGDLLRQAGEKYAEAVHIKPDKHEAFNNWGVCLANWARRRPNDEAEDLFRQADEKYAEAVRIKPDMHEAFYNWGLCLADWAMRRPDTEAEDLVRQAGKKYAEAVRIKPDDHEAFNNWGLCLAEWAMRRPDAEAGDLVRQASEKYAEAVRIKPDKHEAFNNWGTCLAEWAKRRPDTEAEDLRRQAGEKYAEAVRIKPDMHEAFDNWSIALLQQAQRCAGPERERLLNEAAEKCEQANRIKPGFGAYNLACVAAVRGDDADCEQWLRLSQEAGSLPGCDHLAEDGDLHGLRDKAWYQEFLAEICGKCDKLQAATSAAVVVA